MRAITALGERRTPTWNENKLKVDVEEAGRGLGLMRGKEEVKIGLRVE